MAQSNITGSCLHVKKILVSINGEEFINQVRDR